MEEMEKDLQDEIEETPAAEESVDEEIDEDVYAEDGEETSDDDVGFEYDEDGNIVIPEDEEDESWGEESNGEESADAPSEDTASEEAPAVNDSEPAPAADGKNENEELKREFEKYKKRVKDTLKRYGYEGDDDIKGLAQIAADVSGQDPDEYLAEVEKQEAEEAKQNEDFEALAKSDLEILKKEYPELSSYKHITDMPKEILAEFARNRGMGLDAKKAYAAANPDGIRAHAAEAAKKHASQESKAHLKSRVPKGTAPESVSIPPSELKDWMASFPNLTKKQIVELYVKTKTN